MIIIYQHVINFILTIFIV